MKKYILNQLGEIVNNNIVSFHVPGHKLGKIYDRLGYSNILENIYKMDTTEILGTDNLHSPDGIIKKSQERAARVFKSKNTRSEEHTSELQSRFDLVCRLLLEKKNS